MLFFASGRVEENVSFGCFGGNAAKTTEKDSQFLASHRFGRAEKGSEFV
jgi:hypothetical protein